MKRKISVLLILTMTLLVMSGILAGCGGSTGSSSNPNEMKDYFDTQLPDLLNGYSGIAAVNAEAMKGADNAEVAEGLKSKVLPAYKEVLDKANAIKPANPDVKAVHDAFVKALTTEQNSIQLLVDSVAQNDQAKFQSSADKMSESKTLFSDFVTKAKDIAGKNNLTFNYKAGN